MVASKKIMTRTSLKHRIFVYLRSNPNVWFASGHIERMTFAATDYVASNAARRLRELHEERSERVEREFRKGAHGEKLAYYRYVPSMDEVRYQAMQDAN